MGMTIDESLANIKELQKDYQQFHDDVWQDPESYGIMEESLQVAISTMSKFQKIERIIEVWHQDIYAKDFECIAEVAEVVEDGNAD